MKDISRRKWLILLATVAIIVTLAFSANVFAAAVGVGPTVPHNVMLELDGSVVGAFIGVSGLEMTTQVIESTAPDGTPYKHPGSTSCANIVLKTGIQNQGLALLWQWYKEIIEGSDTHKDGAIIMLGPKGTALARYNFFDAWPCNWKVYHLKEGEPGNIFVEFEIVVKRITQN